jgi:hypothetical protein
MDSLRMKPHPRAGSSPDNVTQDRTTKLSGCANEAGGLTQVNRRLKPLDSSNDSNLVDRGRECKSFEWLSVSVRRRCCRLAVSCATSTSETANAESASLQGCKSEAEPDQREQVNVGSPLSGSSHEGQGWCSLDDKGWRSFRSSRSLGKPDTGRREAVRMQSLTNEEDAVE